MDKIIYLKYGELTLKGKNRREFSSLTFNNLKIALKEYTVTFKKNFDNVIISDIDDEVLNDIINISTKIPGFCNLSIAYICEKNIDIISKNIMELIENNKTFKVISRRKDKSFFLNSDQINRKVANDILENKNCINKVDIHKPEIKVNIEINDVAIFYFNKIACCNGLPVGINGRVLVLLSGGIDSCVASHLLMKRGLHVDFLTFITPPHTSEMALQKVIDLTKIITLNNKLEKSKLYICNFTKVQNELTHMEKENYRITLLRRSFMRIATKLAIEKKYQGLATGDSLGQVASQTIESIDVISESTNALIFRPLITYDKNDIIKIAKEINTYETSILPYEDSCSLFAPKNPITKPKIHIAKTLESNLNLLQSIEEIVYNDIKELND